MNDILNAIKDFCEDNYTWILIGVAILLVLIIAAVTGVAVKASRRKKVEKPQAADLEYFLEGEYDEMLKHKAAANKRNDDPQPHDDLETERQEDYTPENEFEELSEKPVHINIKINRGQVNIDRDDEGRILCKVEAEPEEMKPEVMNQELINPVKKEPTGKTADKSESATEQSEGQRDNGGREIIMEKINLIKGASTRKFGPDNLNTSRSGRVYTEEELRRRIKE